MSATRPENDDAYYERCDRLWEELDRRREGAPCVTLACALGISSQEARGKLMSMRSRGLTTFDGAWWHATTPAEERGPDA